MSNPPLCLISAEKLSELPPTRVLGNSKFVAGGLNVVFGASGSFKSFYTLDAALQIAQAAPVIYIAAEGSGGLHRRVAAWCEHYGKSPGQLHFICQEVSLLSPAAVQALVEVAAPIQPTLIVFDTLARCIPGGDENSAKDMGLAVRNSAAVQRALNTAIIWIHHTNKAERGERGSGAIRGAADSMVELVTNGDSVIRASCSKAKDIEPWMTEELRFHPVGDSGVLVPNYGTIDKFSPTEIQVIEFLGLEIFDDAGVRVQQLVNGLNINERHLYRLLSHLKKEHVICHVSKGDPYRLTETGKMFLRQLTGKPAKVLNFVKNEQVTEKTDTTDKYLTLH